jgi:hypothetical protein
MHDSAQPKQVYQQAQKSYENIPKTKTQQGFRATAHSGQRK